MTKGDKITAAGMIGLLLIASGADSMSIPVLLISLAACLGVMEIGHRMKERKINAQDQYYRCSITDNIAV